MTNEELREKMWQILHYHKKEEEWDRVVMDILALIEGAGYAKEPKWRPKEKEWVKMRNKYFEQTSSLPHRTRQNDYEAGADAMLDNLFEMAKESPLGTFTIDSRVWGRW